VREIEALAVGFEPQRFDFGDAAAALLEQVVFKGHALRLAKVAAVAHRCVVL
jgi:hypothetical protein